VLILKRVLFERQVKKKMGNFGGKKEMTKYRTEKIKSASTIVYGKLKRFHCNLRDTSATGLLTTLSTVLLSSFTNVCYVAFEYSSNATLNSFQLLNFAFNDTAIFAFQNINNMSRGQFADRPVTCLTITLLHRVQQRLWAILTTVVRIDTAN